MIDVLKAVSAVIIAACALAVPVLIALCWIDKHLGPFDDFP